MKPRKNRCNDAGLVFDHHAEDKRNARPNYRGRYFNFVLRSVKALFTGMVLMAFFEALGFGGFLFGAALFFLGRSFFHFP